MILVAKAIRLCIISIMIYHMIDSTLKYRQYKTVIKSEFKYFEEGDLPSLTLCPRDPDWKYVTKKLFQDSKLAQGKLIKYEFKKINDSKANLSIDVGYHHSSKPNNYLSPFEDKQYFSLMTDLII